MRSECPQPGLKPLKVERVHILSVTLALHDFRIGNCRQTTAIPIPAIADAGDPEEQTGCVPVGQHGPRDEMAGKLRLGVGRWGAALKTRKAAELLETAPPPSDQAAIVMPQEARLLEVEVEPRQELMEIEHLAAPR